LLIIALMRLGVLPSSEETYPFIVKMLLNLFFMLVVAITLNEKATVRERWTFSMNILSAWVLLSGFVTIFFRDEVAEFFQNLLPRALEAH